MKKWFKAKGCSLYCDFQDDRDTIEFTDIVVDDDIEELQLAGAPDAMDKIAIYDLKNCSRSFPNVKKLVIGMLTRNIIDGRKNCGQACRQGRNAVSSPTLNN